MNISQSCYELTSPNDILIISSGFELQPFHLYENSDKTIKKISNQFLLATFKSETEMVDNGAIKQ